MNHYTLNLMKCNYLPVSFRFPTNFFHNIKAFFRNCKYGYQRVIRGYSDFDSWDLGDFYISLMIDSLKDFKENHQGIPGPYYNPKLSDEGNAYYEYEIQQLIDSLERSTEEYYEDEFNAAAAEGLATAYKAIDKKMTAAREEAMRRLAKLLPTLWS